MRMTVLALGSGPPVVVVPGVQGRWEWLRPGIEALAARCRVVTFSLADEPSCGGTFEPARGFDCYVEQVREALDAAEIERATVCGVSYGGLIAAAFASRYPQRTNGLVLVSALTPSWRPDARVRFYLRAPRLLAPLFMLASLRMYVEIAAAHGGFAAGLPAAVRHAWNVLTHMFSPTRMARRVRLLCSMPPIDVSNVRAPVLLITGEPALDRVVPVHATREYLRLLPHARVETLERTGHLGLVTRPEAFAALVAPFAAEAAREASRRRVV